MRPVIRASICTGKQVAGFKDRRNHVDQMSARSGILQKYIWNNGRNSKRILMVSKFTKIGENFMQDETFMKKAIIKETGLRR